MSENLHVSKEFFEGQLGQTMPKPEKSGGPTQYRPKKQGVMRYSGCTLIIAIMLERLLG